MSYIKAIPAVLSKTANYTVSTNDGDNVQVNVSASGGAVTIVFYAASGNAGKIITVKKTDSSANAVTLDGNASETLDGATTLTLSAQHDSATLVCDGTNWIKASAMGAGAIPISGMAAGDDIYASSSTQLAAGARQLRQSFRGLTVRTHPDADVAAYKVYLDHADEIVLHDGTRVADWNNLVANITASGAGGLDTGSEAASTWYEIHAIRKSSDGTKNLLLHRAKNYGADQTFGGDSSNDNVRVGAADRVKLAQGFQITTAGPLPFIDLQINKTNSPVGNLWATIESDSAGNPSGTALATSDKFDVSLVPTTRGWIRFVFRTSPTLSASTQYHIVLQGDWTMNGTNVVAWRGDNTGYANGSGKKYDGTNWAAAGVSDFAFKTYITQNDTAVTMPSGYDQRALVGYVYNDSSSDFMVMRAVGRVVSSGAVTLGTYTTTTYTLTDLSVVMPPVPVVAKFMATISGATDSTLAGMADLYYDAAGRDPRNLITLPTSSRYYGPMYMPLTLPQAVYFMNNNTLGTISAYCSGYEW